jgi:hypothetical protein
MADVADDNDDEYNTADCEFYASEEDEEEKQPAVVKSSVNKASSVAQRSNRSTMYFGRNTNIGEVTTDRTSLNEANRFVKYFSLLKRFGE